MEVIKLDNIGLRLTRGLALRDVSFVIKRNDIVSIYGDTLFTGELVKMIYGTRQPESGCLSYVGQKYEIFTKLEADYIRANDMSYIDSASTVYKELDVMGNVLIATIINRQQIDDEHVNDLFELFDLNELVDKNISELTEYQKVLIKLARALVNKPFILLLNDFMRFISSVDQKRIMEKVVKAKDLFNLTVVQATNNMDIAYECSTKIIYIVDGQLIKEELNE